MALGTGFLGRTWQNYVTKEICIFFAFVVFLPIGKCGPPDESLNFADIYTVSNTTQHLWKSKYILYSELDDLQNAPINRTNEENRQLDDSLDAGLNTSKSQENVDSSYQTFLEVKKYLDPIIMSFILIFGAVTNGTLLVIFWKHSEMRTASNACILTMAMGDFMSVIVNVPLFYVLLISESWQAGVPACKLMWFFSDFSVGVSIFSVTILSVQRYHGIVNTNVYVRKGPFTIRSSFITIFNISLIWIVPFSFALRTAVTTDVSENMCRSVGDYYGNYLPKNLAMFNLFVFCIIPLCVIAVFYSMTAVFLVKSARQIPGESSEQKSKQTNARRKGAKIVLALTAVFFLSYVPWYTWQVVFFWGNYASNPQVSTITYTFLYYFFFGNLCFNPIALYCVSSTFRNHFNNYLFCRKKLQSFEVEQKQSTSVKINKSFSDTPVTITTEVEL